MQETTTEPKQKFFKLERDFHVALQSNIDPKVAIEDYLKNDVAPYAVNFNPEKGFIFHSGCVFESLGKKRIREVRFCIITNGSEKKKSLVFRAKTSAIAARFGETKPFGFDGSRPGLGYKGLGYCNLRFPGITGVFMPMYIKLNLGFGRKKFLEVQAFEDKKASQIVVTCKSARNYPRHLL